MKFSKKILTVFIFVLSSAFVFAEVYKENAVVSYYAEAFHGKRTSNGETFNMYQLTCANKTLPFDTQLKVTNLSNNKSVEVRINDRGPFVAGRELDLSKAAAIQLDMIKDGTANVRIEIIKLGPNTKISQQTAASAAKIMAAKGEVISYNPTGKGDGGSASVVSNSKTIKISSDKYYDFQLGAFSNKDNAKNFASKVSKDGFKNIVLQTTSKGVVRVVIREVKGSNVNRMKEKLASKGYTEYQIKERKN